MKHKDLIKILEENGYCLLRHGGNHDVYIKDNKMILVLIHKEVNEQLAKSIIRKLGK